VAASVPVVVVSRPGAGPDKRLNAPKDWIFINARYYPESSTALRTRKRVPVAKPKRK